MFSQNQELQFYYLADIDEQNILFGKAVTNENIPNSNFAMHEPSLKQNGEIVFQMVSLCLTAKTRLQTQQRYKIYH